MTTAGDVLAANLAALRRLQPGLVLPSGDGRARDVDGTWRLERGGHTVAIHGRYPDREADRAAQELLGETHPDLLVVIGLGLGYLLEALDRRGFAGKVLALECEPATVPALLARRDWRAWIDRDRLRVLAGPAYPGAADCARWLGDAPTAPPVFVHPVLGRGEAGAAARAELERIVYGARSNAQARRQFGGRYLLNTLANLRALAREGDAVALRGAARGRPAVVVAAGPSLDDNLDALHEAVERAVIICVDTALRPLLAHGIEPHLVVALDPSEANARHLVGLPPCATHLVAEASLDPAAIAAFRGRTFLFAVSDHQPWPWLRQHGAARGQLRAWGSVLTSAFDLALAMGADPIVFAGADLAFTGYRPYARGVVYEQDWRRLDEWGISYEEQWRQQVDAGPPTEEADVHGRPARTAPQLVQFRDWLVEQVGREHRRFVNATGAGILHGGRLEQAPLADILASRPPGQVAPHDLVRSHYRPMDGAPVLAAAALIAGDRAAVPAEWVEFADGLSAPRIREALRAAIDPPAPAAMDAAPTTERARVRVESYWLDPLAASVPMVRLPLPAERLYPFAPGVRLFRFQTTASRLISCVLQPPEGGVTEDGTPMPASATLEALRPGECFVWRDEVYIAPADGSDPRHNGRTYSLLVPAPVAYLERLPLHDVLAHHV